jgi:hypothetical protein
MKEQNQGKKVFFLKLMLLTAMIAVLALICGTVATADDVTVSNRPAVGLVLLDDLMSGHSKVGDIVHYQTIAPVYDSSSHLLIPAGSSATGRVTRSKGSGMFGKRGQLDFTCETITLPNGERVPLVGKRVGGSGTNDTGTTAAVAVLVSPVGLLIKGGTVKCNRGMPIRMFIADGARITPAGNNPPPIRVDFSLQDKKSDITGLVTGFDGDDFTVRSKGQDQTIALKDISSISLDAPQDNN